MKKEEVDDGALTRFVFCVYRSFIGSTIEEESESDAKRSRMSKERSRDR